MIYDDGSSNVKKEEKVSGSWIVTTLFTDANLGNLPVFALHFSYIDSLKLDYSKNEIALVYFRDGNDEVWFYFGGTSAIPNRIYIIGA
jgi:hypothetical protein